MANDKKEFGRFLQEDIMWKMKPPWNASKLARALGLSTTAILNWIKGVSVPRPEAIIRLHAVMVDEGITSITIEQLFEIAGFEWPPVPPSPWETAVSNVNKLPFPDEAKEHIIQTIREEEAKYNAAG